MRPSDTKRVTCGGLCKVIVQGVQGVHGAALGPEGKADGAATELTMDGSETSLNCFRMGDRGAGAGDRVVPAMGGEPAPDLPGAGTSGRGSAATWSLCRSSCMQRCVSSTKSRWLKGASLTFSRLAASRSTSQQS